MKQVRQPTSQAGSRNMIGSSRRRMFSLCSVFSNMATQEISCGRSRLMTGLALPLALLTAGCQQRDEVAQARIEALEARVSNLERTPKQAAAVAPAPVEKHDVELFGLPGARRIYDSFARCEDARKAIAASEDEAEQARRQQSIDTQDGPARVIYVPRAKSALRCIVA